MKYFAVAVVFGLFALSQALPVEESKEKRLFFNKETLMKVVGLAKGACVKLGDSHQIVTRACHCLDAATDIAGMLGDENISEDEKRFLFKVDYKYWLGKLSDAIDKLCKGASSDYENVCKCISFKV
ncbi:uncharacterized protein LOC114517795 [Dendronephthya gigantea]|uniref:uncharacterized protein LOC114517795 n=1 Tax=Dendronephthya gigantea TaxID=151771 RepID=UPI00106CAB26|nr:uncharacterized protein LOC114517795 [Dendronephthya gigantea]